MNTADPQQINGYSYADDRPVTSADPTGLEHDEEGGCEAACLPDPADTDPNNPGPPTSSGPPPGPRSPIASKKIPVVARKDPLLHRNLTKTVYFYNVNGQLVAVTNGCELDQVVPGVACTRQWGQQTLGPVVPCQPANSGPVCYEKDGGIYDTDGNHACAPGTMGPCVDQPKAPPTSRRDCKPVAPPSDPAKPSQDPCKYQLACSAGSFLSFVGAAVGVFGAANPLADLIGTGLGYASAGLYAAGGDHDRAVRQMIATTVGIFAGSLGGQLASAGARGFVSAIGQQGARWAPAAVRGGSAVGSFAGNSAAIAPFCGWSPGCSQSAPGLGVYTPTAFWTAGWAPTMPYAPGLTVPY